MANFFSTNLVGEVGDKYQVWWGEEHLTMLILKGKQSQRKIMAVEVENGSILCKVMQ